MANIQMARSVYDRTVTKAPYISLKNRLFEANPSLNTADGFTSLFSRPSLRKYIELGEGHCRLVFSEPGTFSEGAFVISGTELYLLKPDGTYTDVGQISTSLLGSPSCSCTAGIGDTVPDYFFMGLGRELWCYTDNGAAIGHLTITGAISAGEQVSINGIYYQFTSGSVDAGTPAGTSAAPWLVALGASDGASLTNLFYAINGTGTPGTTYSTALTAATTFTGYNVTSTDLYVAASTAGTAGNGYVLTETLVNGAWDAGTMSNGGLPLLRQIAIPNDLGCLGVCSINSYVLVIPVQNSKYNGRFYWLNPGETVIDPLDWATAERSPDAILQAVAASDRVWLFGQSTTEAWTTTGDLNAPFQRFSGMLFDRGQIAGSAVKMKEDIVTVDQDGAVFQIGMGGFTHLTEGRPDIEELFRRAGQALP